MLSQKHPSGPLRNVSGSALPPERSRSCLISEANQGQGLVRTWRKECIRALKLHNSHFGKIFNAIIKCPQRKMQSDNYSVLKRKKDIFLIFGNNKTTLESNFARGVENVQTLQPTINTPI
jgi:hypothetical protein